MKMMTLAALALTSNALATIHIEITRSGDRPDGFVDGGYAFGDTASLDIWVWGRGVDTTLTSITFGATGNVFEWQIDSLGFVDPDGLGIFGEPGRIEGVDIVDAGILAIPPIDIGGGIDNAVRIYGGFVATNLQPLGRLDPFVTAATTDAGSDPFVRTYGIIQTPAPGAMGVLGLACLGRRRR